MQTGEGAEREDEKRRATTGRKSRREGTSECEASSAVMADEGGGESEREGEGDSDGGE